MFFSALSAGESRPASILPGMMLLSLAANAARVRIFTHRHIDIFTEGAMRGMKTWHDTSCRLKEYAASLKFFAFEKGAISLTNCLLIS